MYEVRILPSARRDLEDLPQAIFARTRETLIELGKTPRPIGSIKLTGEEGYRVRIGSYRILYRIDDHHKKIFIYRVKHRRDVYR